MKAARALGLVALAGCTATPAPDGPARAFLPDAAGLAVSGTALRVDFGRAPQGVIRAVTREQGAPATLSLADCPPGIARRLIWEDLELTFTREAFVGWRKGGGSSGLICGAA